MAELNDLLKEEHARLKPLGWVYFSKPYSCSKDEALGYFYNFPHDPKRTKITRHEKETIISISPRPGWGLRKPYIIRLWVA